jgi:hypothetical protein
MSGWIKLHRQITDWEWYDDHNTFRLFIHLLLKANHKERSYRGTTIEVGCIMTGRELLSKETGLSVQQIRTCLERLKLTNEITIKSDKQGTIIQVVKYKDYQVSTNELTTNQPTSNQQVTTNNNDNKEKNDNNTFKPPTANDVKSYCLERNNFVNAETFIDFYESKGWMVGKNKMKDWKACVRTWEKTNTKPIQQKDESTDNYMNHVMKQVNQIKQMQ